MVSKSEASKADTYTTKINRPNTKNCNFKSEKHDITLSKILFGSICDGILKKHLYSVKDKVMLHFKLLVGPTASAKF